MRRTAWFAAFASVVGLGAADFVQPAYAACDLSEAERVTVATAEDGDTLALSDGRTVRLVGVHAPAPPLGWRGDDPWPLVQEAKATLTRLAAGQEVELKFGGRRSDRHGRSLAHVFVVQGEKRVWLQQALVADGFARVYSFPDNRSCVAELLASEADARAKHRGIWGVSAYRVREASDLEGLDRLMHSYQLVEGVVVAIGEARDRLYLNFGEDWRRDFTVSVERKDAAAFAAAGLDLKALAGKRVRARGWLQWRNGPEIRATHAEQLELVPEATSSDGGGL